MSIETSHGTQHYRKKSTFLPSAAAVVGKKKKATNFSELPFKPSGSEYALLKTDIFGRVFL